MDLNLLTIEAARSAVQERQITATALAEAFLQKIEAEDPQVGAYLITCRERALAQAAEIDRLAEQGARCRRWAACR